MSTAKAALTVTSLATAMLFGGGIYLYMNFSSLAKNLAEDYATRTLGVKVNIDQMQVSLRKNTIDIAGLKIDNPDGYSDAHAVVIEKIHIDTGAIGPQLLEFKSITTSGADIFLAMKSDATNLGDIRKGLNENIGAAESESDSAVVVIMDKLLLNGTVYTARNTMAQDQENLTFAPLPYSMDAAGHASTGVLPGQAISGIWKEISENAVRSAHEHGYMQGVSAIALRDAGMGQMEIYKNDLDKGIDAVTDGLKDLFESGEQ